MDKNYFLRGVLPIIFAASLWAAGYSLRKGIFDNVSPILVNLITCFFVSAITVAIYQLKLNSITKRIITQPFQYIGLSLTGVVFGSTFMFLALHKLDLSIATLLEKLQPIFTVFLGICFLKEKLNYSKIPYMVIAIICSYFVTNKTPLSFNYSESQAEGLIYVVLAGFSWALASIIGKSIVDKEAKAEEVTFLRFFLGGIILSPLILLKNELGLKLNIDAYVLLIIILAAFLSTTLGYILYYKGLKYVEAGTAGFLELFTPVVGIALGLLFYNEQLVITQWITAPLLLFSIYYISK